MEGQVKPDHFWQDLRDAQDTALEQSNNVRVVRERMPSRPPIEERRFKRPLAVAATLSLAAAIVLGIIGLRHAPTAISFEVGDKKEIGRVETWIAAPDGANLPIKFSDGSDVTVEPGARARVTKLDEHGAHVLLERGRAVATVVHRENTHWQVAAGPFLVSVIGTRFAVSWDPVSEVFRLHLHEGRVLVSGSFLRDAQSVSTGQTLRASCKEGRSEIVEVQAGGGIEPAAGVDPAAAMDRTPESVDSNDPAGSAQSASSRAAEGSSRKVTWQELAAAGKYREALESAERSGFDAECRHASGKDLLALGDAARLAGNASRARQAYLAARDKIPGGGRASYGLGLLAFDQQLDFGEAARWFEAYVSGHPGGALRREAEGRLIEAWQRAGDSDKARRAAARYLLDYPTGAHAALARQLTSR
jgi:transmembrane sensor